MFVGAIALTSCQAAGAESTDGNLVDVVVHDTPFAEAAMRGLFD